MSFTIAKIGIEFEFDIDWWFNSSANICRDIVDLFNSKNPNYSIEMDREYYSNQIEFKLHSTDDLRWWIDVFKRFLVDLYREVRWVKCTAKPFIGTHIHLFLEKDGVPYSLVARGKKLPIFDYVYNYFSRWITWEDSIISMRNLWNEALRLTTNHNILRHFDRNVMWDKMRKQLDEFGFNYEMFHWGINRPKYTPVLWSLFNPTTGKPHSLEIRAIPNSWFITSTTEEVYKFVCQLEILLNTKYDKHRDYIGSIMNAHKSLIKFVIQH